MVKQTCRRCQLISDHPAGQFDLVVQSVRLGEDEDFECQVLPGQNAPVKVPLRAAVHVTIQGKLYRI